MRVALFRLAQQERLEMDDRELVPSGVWLELKVA